MYLVRLVSWKVRTADNAWICDLLDCQPDCQTAHVQRVMNGLACAPYFSMCRADLPHREGKSEGRQRVRTHCDSGWAGACAGKVQATGTGDWGFGGEGGRHGGGGTPGTGDLGTATRLGQDKRCGSATGPPGLVALLPSCPLGHQAFRAPSVFPSNPALRGPDAPTEHTIPPGPV